MALSLSPITQTPTQTPTQTQRMRARLPVRLSGAASPYVAETNAGVLDGAIGLQITPIYSVEQPQHKRLPAPSFSAQLLELGLKHNVEGLIQKAAEQLSYHGAEPHSLQKNAARNYERAQDNFARDTLHMVERQY